jgi:glycosyltransferase involved in cell wall biosynthesis
MSARRIRVCLFIGGREGGGLATCILQMVQGLDSGRIDLRVAACEDAPYVAQLRAAGVPCDVLHAGRPPLLRKLLSDRAEPAWRGYPAALAWGRRAARALATYVARERFDLVHTNYYHFHFLAGLAPLGNRVRLVWHWHGVERRRALLRSAWLIRRLTHRRVWFIANSRATYDSIAPLAGSRRSLVYNGIAIDPVRPSPGELRGLVGLPASTRIVGMVGSLNPIKGHPYFLQAASILAPRFPDLHFVYIGGHTAAGQDAYLHGLLEQRRASNLDGRVHFLGHRPDAARLMAGFDVMTVCTLPPGEGFGLVTVEALARQVAVVSTREGAASEILRDNETGLLIPARDAAALAAAVERLLRDDTLRLRIAEAGFRDCCERFDVRRTMRELEAAYDRALSLGRGESGG